jgi:ribosomal protein S27E
MTHPRMAQIEALWDKHVYFAEREEKMADVFCPECLKRMPVYHLDFTAIVCPNCKKDIDKISLLRYDGMKAESLSRRGWLR